MREEQKAAFEPFRPRLLRVCQAYLGDQQDEAADIVQDLFLQAGHKVDPAEAPEEAMQWLTQLARQLCSARLRCRIGFVLSLKEELEIARHLQAVEKIESFNLELQKQQRIGVLCEAIKPLSLPGRQMLQLRHVKGLSYAQISATLGLSWPAVAQRLSDAREEMRASLGQDQPETAATSLTRGPWGLQLQ